jgi:membrane protease YdiL (CAAX protease family)
VVFQVGEKEKKSLKKKTKKQETDGTDVVHTTSPVYHAKRHLVFACVALLQAPLAVNAWPLVESFLSSGHPWSVELELISRLLPLCFAAFIGWLAFERFNTGSGVMMLPTRWADVGVLALMAYGIREVVAAGILLRAPPALLAERKTEWIRVYLEYDGGLMFGWLILAALVGALTEEIVYRGLVLRALEGFMDRWSALVVHALVFELVHVFIYGHGFRGGMWFIVALIYGYAFQRTCSLAVPVLMHATSIVLYEVSLWLLAP